MTLMWSPGAGDALNTQDNVRRDDAEHNDLSHEHQPCVFIQGWDRTVRRASCWLDRVDSGQCGCGFRYRAFWFEQDDQLVPRKLGAHLFGGQLAAHRAAH